MRIAQVAQLFEPVPPPGYGGTERVVSWLTEELVEAGHDVTLFASGDSATRARLCPVIPRSIRLSSLYRDYMPLYVKLLEDVLVKAPEFDIIHFHIDTLPFPLFTRQKTPFLSTLHGRLDLPEYHLVYGMYPTAPLVPISMSQRGLFPADQRQHWMATVHNGLPEDSLRPLTRKRDYLAFLGRISPEKGIEAAIEIARRSKIPLKIAAKIDKADHDYFEQRVRPLLGSDVVCVGEINDAQKAEFLSGAVALLFPIAWPEPFGLAMIEAMACATPVIAFDKGSVREVIDDGVTGFVVPPGDIGAAVACLGRASRLSPDIIRQSFERRFTARRMALAYVAIYEDLIASAALRDSASGAILELG